ncbi:MAG: DUF547 domain-containing protein [Bacteroidia bacterium]
MKYAPLIGLVLLFACRAYEPAPQSQADIDSHALWDSLLLQYVDTAGWVNYAAWQQDTTLLNVYLQSLSDHPPTASASEQDRIAYWINAYNAFIVKLILRHYPLSSITDLHQVPYVAPVWKEAWFEIGGQAMSLDRIEHGILRRDFAEPRIHFAINCASYSCPVLRREAYVGDRLDAQLDEQAQRFLSDTLRNRIAPDRAEISMIFLWFREDFMQTGSLHDFLNRYSPVPVQAHTHIQYMHYDWRLNAQTP